MPAHCVRRDKGVERLKSLSSVAATDVSSNCEVELGPFCGSWKTEPFLTHGEMSIAVVRSPRGLGTTNCAFDGPEGLDPGCHSLVT